MFGASKGGVSKRIDTFFLIKIEIMSSTVYTGTLGPISTYNSFGCTDSICSHLFSLAGIVYGSC